MTSGIVLSVLLACAAVAFVAAPLFRRDAAEAERRSAELSEAGELRSRQDVLVDSLRDLEEDLASSKLDEKDYAQLHASLSAQAVDVMQRLDAIEDKHPPRPRPATPLDRPDPKGSGDPT